MCKQINSANKQCKQENYKKYTSVNKKRKSVGQIAIGVREMRLQFDGPSTQAKFPCTTACVGAKAKALK
uniref:Uncharacterized protein n=1 Tax=Romanomermis culicivorax TaxID=13658 RepID=A0A915IGN2_ROMCU